MSQWYRMSVEITDYNPKRTAEIQAAAAGEWEWDNVWFERQGTGHPPYMANSGESSLAGGERDEDFAYRLRLAIWKANQAYCVVSVDSTYIEELPYERFEGDEKEYEKAKAAGLLGVPDKINKKKTKTKAKKK